MKKLLLILFIAFSSSMFAQAHLSDDNAVLLEEAKEYMQNYSLNDTQATMRLDKVLKSDPENEEANFLRAKAFLEGRGYRYAKKHIDIAIAANSNNTEYRLIRAQSLMTSRSGVEELTQAANDLQFIIDQGKADDEVKKSLAAVEQQLEWNK